jgi:hypothetical protein
LGFVEVLGLAVGLAVGFGAAFGLAVGLGVGLGVGFGVGGGATTIVPGETLDKVTVLAPAPEPLVAVKLYPCDPTESLRLTVKVTPPSQFDPDAVIGIAPTPAMSTTTLDGAQLPVST